MPLANSAEPFDRNGDLNMQRIDLSDPHHGLSFDVLTGHLEPSHDHTFDWTPDGAAFQAFFRILQFELGKRLPVPGVAMTRFPTLPQRSIYLRFELRSPGPRQLQGCRLHTGLQFGHHVTHFDEIAAFNPNPVQHTGRAATQIGDDTGVDHATQGLRKREGFRLRRHRGWRKYKRRKQP